ncbi:cryptococcal mannosyltransferase 1 domain-containing protein [Hirsutella rhossiliensis]|uniref:Cryptococcal mannosyltransferase 1 domain-containing protein n=1 Tax=Hirsutella rhossiliensis TaxID=111463 RepID=A0A9P8MS95_9HYPO|nr:cryptococcal mannosyltransferase 1 domain-containing protein [Hirsutella rhossiliensis]KAH0960219.1 cryptococcal mannosyltransferase 1 domain-containing protein [Hirsutella rhossiliensis]
MSTQGGNHQRIDCPPINRSRYKALKRLGWGLSSRRRFFFALDLRQIVDLLPTLMGSIVEAIRFLGPENCAVSIVEGFSTDGTYEVLKSLQREMDNLGVFYYLQTSDINSHYGDRIGKLAKLRNLALEPMMADAAKWDHDTTILFINDVAICTDDILELLYQKQLQGADMTCSMDYHRLYGRSNQRLAFYDVWVSRSMDGNSFFEVPGHGDWRHAWDMLPNDAHARARFEDRKPFQVFACWNGATAITAAPFLDGQLEFRRAAKHRGECGAGEPTLLCKDMWNMGYNKILVVPSVSLGYSLQEGSHVKRVKGYTSSWTGVEQNSQLALKVQWNPSPPEMVKCIPSWRNQFWKQWNHGLGVPPDMRRNGQ